jgi:hypothetical protein
VRTATVSLAADPGNGPFARLGSRLAVYASDIPLALLIVIAVGAMVALPYWWTGLGWFTFPIYFVLLMWVLLRAGAHLAMRRGSMTVRNHICMRCRYKWTDGGGDRQMEIARFRWEVDSARKRGDKTTLAMALSSLGGLLAMYGTDLREARHYLEESLSLRRESGSPDVGYTLNNLAFVLTHLGQADRARPLADESVKTLRERGEWNGLSSALNTLGLIQLAEGEIEGAEASFREALVMKSKMADWESVAWNLEGLAGVAFAQEEDERAVRLFSAASTMREEGRYHLLSESRRDHEDKLDRLRDRMGQIRYADAWGVGRSMTPEQAVTYAMGEVGLPDYLKRALASGRAQATVSRLSGGLGVALAVGAGFTAFFLTSNIVGSGSGDSSMLLLKAATPVSRTASETLYKFDIFADEYQFYLEDANPEGSSASPMFWDEAAFRRRLAALGDIMAVGTVRSVDVPVEIAMRESTPGDDFEGWDHVVEGSLRVSSGKLVVRGTTDLPEIYIPVDPDTYRMRVYMGALGTGDGSGVEGEDYYRVEIWPAAFRQVRVLKEWVEDR